MHAYTVSDWMSTPPIVVTASTSLTAAREIMRERHVRRLPVMKGSRLIGVVTIGDLREAQPSMATTLSVYEWNALLERVTVAECMTTNPVVIAPDAPVLDAARLMLEKKVSGLPVMQDDQVVGMITESDLFRLLIAELSGAPVENRDKRTLLVCHHCGATMRRHSLASIGPFDQCWRCHYHLHRCDNCRYFDGVSCMLNRNDRHTPIPGQHCPIFAVLTPGTVVAH
jgi:CBS domain-containing protein